MQHRAHLAYSPVLVEGARGTGEQRPLDPYRGVNLQLFCAEMLGSALFVYFANGAHAQVLVGRVYRDQELRSVAELQGNTTSLAPDNFDYGDYLTVAIGAGLALSLATAVSGAVSGAHLNPAISLTISLFRHMPVRVLPSYVIGQLLGSFVGMGFVHTIHARLHFLQSKGVDTSPAYFSRPTFSEPDDSAIVRKKIEIASMRRWFLFLRRFGIKFWARLS